MQNRIRLISGRVPTTNSSNLASDRYQYLDLASAEPNLGTSIDGNILSYDSSILGGRKWITQESVTQPSFNVANSASANTIITQGVDATQNTRLNIIETINVEQNTRLNSIETVNIDQNTSISIIQGTDLTQNTRLNSIETINTNQNTSISIIEGVDLGQNATITAVNQYAVSAYNSANTNATNLTYLNSYAESAYAKANTNALNIISVNQYAASGYDLANTTAINLSSNVGLQLGINLTQNTRIDSIETINNNQNTSIGIIQGVDVTQNTRINSIETINTNQNNAITIIQGVDLTQNTRLDSIETINTNQNNIISIIQGVDLTQNTRLDSIENINNNQNTAIEIIQGVDETQNTRLNSIETINVNQNTSIGIIQDVDATQNTRLNSIETINTNQNTSIGIIQGVDVTQNTRINSIETINTNQNNAITIIQGVDLGQNATITAVNQFAQSSYNTANTKLNSSGGTITGSLTINNDLVVSGNLSVLGNTFAVSANTLEVKDSLITLGVGNYTSDIIDIGFAGHYNDGTNAHTGLIRDAGNKEWYLFQGYTPIINGNNNIDINNSSFQTSNLNAGFVKGNLIGRTVSVNGLDVTSVFNTQNNTTIAVNQYAGAAYTQANVTVGVDATQNTRLDSIETVNVNQNTSISIIQGVDSTQNTQISGIQGVDLAQNTAISIIQGVDLGQNTTITAVNQFAQSAYNTANGANGLAAGAYNQANVTIGVDATQNTRLDSIETVNANQNTAVAIIQGVDNTQNTRLSSIETINVNQNNAISIIQGVDLGQNATITAVNQFAQSSYNTANGANGLAAGAYEQANVTIGVDATQNTRLDSIETVNVNQNTAIAIIQGVDLGQNVTIAAVNQFAAAGYAHANNAYDQANVTIGVDATQNTRLNSIETVNNNQNTSISIIEGVNAGQNVLIQTVFDTANTGHNFVTLGGTVSGNVSILGNLDITGNISVIGNVTNVVISGNSGQFFGNNTTGFEALYAGIATGYDFQPQTVFQTSGNFNGYSQINNQNINPGQNASTDYVATADNGSEEDTFIDMGIGSSNYGDPEFELHGPNDGYLYVHGNTALGGGNLVLSTKHENDIIFSANGITAADEVARFKFDEGLILKRFPLTFADSTSQNTAAAPANYTQSSYDTANSATSNTIYTQGVDLTQNTRLNSIETINTNQNTSISIIQGVDLGQNATITAVNQFAQSAYNTANNKLDLSGGVVYGNVTVNNLTANVSVISPELRSTGGTTHVYTSDIGIVAIDVNGGQTKFFNSGVEVPGDVYAGTFGGNRISLGGNEAKLQSLRTDTVQIQTGTDGSVSNTWTFNGNKLTFPDNSVQNTAFTGVALDQFVRDVANSASANTIVTQGVDAWQNNAIITLQSSLITINSNSAYSSAIDVTQNTRLDSIETVNNNQNTSIGIIQGVDLWQNTQITYVNQFAQAAFDAANSSVSSGIDFYARDTANSAVAVNNNQNTSINIIQGVDLTQNTNITAVNNFAQSAYNTANGANGLAAGAFDKANNALPLTGGTLTGSLIISNNNDLTVTGNLYILGNTTAISANTLEVKDSMIMLGIGNYTTDIVDIGFAGHYNAGTNAHTGLIRDADNKEWYLFQGYTPALGGNNNIDISDASFSTSNLNANYLKGNLISTTAVVDGLDIISVFNTQNTNISIIQGVNLGQNATITAVNQFAQSAYNKANTGTSVTYSANSVIFANSAGFLSNTSNLQFFTSNNTLVINGTLAATSKSFLIPHPTKEGKQLRYGSLEGPENGVYVRGRITGNNVIELPDYWVKLVDENSMTVQLTPINKHQNLFVKDITNNIIIIENGNMFNKDIDCFYIVFAERKDVEKLIVEAS